MIHASIVAIENNIVEIIHIYPMVNPAQRYIRSLSISVNSQSDIFPTLAIVFLCSMFYMKSYLITMVSIHISLADTIRKINPKSKHIDGGYSIFKIMTKYYLGTSCEFIYLRNTRGNVSSLVSSNWRNWETHYLKNSICVKIHCMSSGTSIHVFLLCKKMCGSCYGISLFVEEVNLIKLAATSVNLSPMYIGRIADEPAKRSKMKILVACMPVYLMWKCYGFNSLIMFKSYFHKHAYWCIAISHKLW